jgi:hypothetical protein
MGYMSEDNTEAIELASSIAYDEVEKALLSDSSVAPEGEWKPGDPAIVKESKNGSFEKLIGFFQG